MRILLPSLALLLLAVGNASANDGNTATKTAPAGVTLVKPIKVTKTQDLYFGQVLVDPSTHAGTLITMGTDSGKPRFMSKGGSWQYAKATRQPQPARFAVSGEAGYPYVMTAVSAIFLTTSGQQPQGAKAVFKALLKDPGALIVDGDRGTIPDTEIVGGILEIPPAVEPGEYTGTFTVCVEYL